jgi:hypothetical protein
MVMLVLPILLLVSALVAGRLSRSVLGRLRCQVGRTRSLGQHGLLLIALARLRTIKQVEQVGPRVGRRGTVAERLLWKRLLLLLLLGLLGLVGATHKSSQETGWVSRRWRGLVNLSGQRALNNSPTLLSVLLELVKLVQLMLWRQLSVQLLRGLVLLLMVRVLLCLLLTMAMSASLSSLTLQL